MILYMFYNIPIIIKMFFFYPIFVAIENSKTVLIIFLSGVIRHLDVVCPNYLHILIIL